MWTRVQTPRAAWEVGWRARLRRGGYSRLQSRGHRTGASRQCVRLNDIPSTTRKFCAIKPWIRLHFSPRPRPFCAT